MANGASEGEADSDGPRRPERGLNRVTLIGRVGREPDHRGTGEHPCIIFPLATNASFRKANGELMSRTDWHRICVFKPGLRDNIGSRIGKGDRVYVEGSISYSRFSGEDNKNITITSIVAEDLMIMARRLNNPNRIEEEEEENID